jgi:hypothetical protein
MLDQNESPSILVLLVEIASPNITMSAKVAAGDAYGVRDEDMITLCLTGAGLARRHVLKISSAATVQELAAECQHVFGVSASTTNNDPKGGDRTTIQCQLQHGFPPRVLDLVTLNNCSLREAGIQNQDRIDVTILVVQKETPLSPDTNADQGEESPKKRRKASKQFSSSESGPSAEAAGSTGAAAPRRKRAAAAAAEASFADTLRQQDQILRSESRKSPSHAAGKKSKQKQQQQSPSQTASARFQASSTVGWRLEDGAQVAPRKRRQATGAAGAYRGGGSNDNDENDQAGTMSREEAGALALLRAVDGNGSGGGAASERMSRLMRSNWRQAVNSAYEQNQAVARLAAIASGIVQMEVEGAAASLGAASEESPAGSPATLVVTYPKGVQGRGNYVDRVDFLPLDVLRSVVAAIHPQNPEALRGANLALLSPRVLWSLVYHARSERETNADSSSAEGRESAAPVVASLSVETALQMVQPDLDWTFLRRRKEQLSEKARENLRQKRETQGPSRSDDWGAAAAAIESVENAMANLSALHRSQRATQCSQAASRRVAWTVMTPSEVDEDELRECIGSSVPPRTAAQAIQALLRQGIHNWRELANADARRVREKLKIPNLPEEAVQSWIDKAQDESIEEIMVEICGGSVAGVELLREANSGTPRDLAMWEPIVPSLHSALSNAVKLEMESDDVPPVEELRQWCGRAQRAMEQLPWIGMFSTPV